MGLIGKTISHYEILEQIGQGGMGVVYKAQDLTLNRFVALKFLPHGSLDRHDSARFENEARAISSLNHKNIATIHELAADGSAEGDKRQFIVFEFLPKGTLKDKLRLRGKLSAEETIAVAQQLCEGLAHAHSKHIIHRDIKSENIMFGEDTTPKITDFGISKICMHNH